MRRQLELVSAAWHDSGRDTEPQRVAGFWYCLAPDADQKLKAYVYKYVKIAGDGIARAMASRVDSRQNEVVPRTKLERLFKLLAGFFDAGNAPLAADLGRMSG